MAIKRKGWSPRPCDIDDSASWEMKFHIKAAMPWYLALWMARRAVRGVDAKNFFWKWIIDFRLGSVLHESKWPDQGWYLRAFEAERKRWDADGMEMRRT